jgi:hypothetical protein
VFLGIVVGGGSYFYVKNQNNMTGDYLYEDKTNALFLSLTENKGGVLSGTYYTSSLNNDLTYIKLSPRYSFLFAITV